MIKYKYEKGIKVNIKTISLLEEANKLFHLFYNTFYNNNINDADEIQIMKKKIIERLYNLLENNQKKENIIIYHIGEIIRNTQMASTVLFGLKKEIKY